MIKKIGDYIIKHTNTITDYFFFLVVIAVSFPLYRFFLNGLDLYIRILLQSVENGMSDTFQLVFISGFIYITILLFGLIIKTITYLSEQTKKISEDVIRPRKKKN